MQEDDVEARVLVYFSSFNTIIEQHRLQTVLGRTLGRTPDKVARAKYRTKILLENLSPDMLKKDVTRIMTHEQVSAKTDEVALFNIVLKRAREQHHYYLLTAEERRARAATKGTRDATAARSKQPKESGRRAQADTKSHAVSSAPTAPATASSTPASRPPRRNGCLVCKGPQWMSDCKHAMKEQKDVARDAQRSRSTVRASKRAAMSTANDQLTIVLAEGIKITLCADSGSEKRRSCLKVCLAACRQRRKVCRSFHTMCPCK